MSIPLEWLVFLISSLICIYLCYKWRRKSRDKAEPTIAMIGAVTSVILYFLNEYTNIHQTKDLIAIHQSQINSLQDTLENQIKILQLHNDSISKTLDSCQNNLSFNQQNGKANSSVYGNNNVSVVGNDGSTITISTSEKPFLEKDININAFTNTHIKIEKGDRVFISATGSIKVGLNAGYSGPDGKESGVWGISLEPWNLVSQFKHACLMFKIDMDSDWKECGKAYKFTADKRGAIIFEINDKKQSDNEGAYSVTVQVYR